MTRHDCFLPFLLFLFACRLERIEAALAERGVTETATTAPADDTTAAHTTTGAPLDTTTIDTTTSTTTAGEAGHDASGDPGSTTDSTSASSSTTATTDAPPYCGDGQQDPGEECDDGNADPKDGCKLCARDRLIFASSVEYQGGELEGLYGADQRCRMLAAIAMLPNFATYRAWLSDSTTSAADRLVHHRGRYLLVNGLVVANDWDDLVDGTLAHSIDVTEYSETQSGGAWTGTLASGQPALGSSFCFDWTKAQGWYDEKGGNGVLTQTDALWSYFEQANCTSVSVIYCIEQ